MLPRLDHVHRHVAPPQYAKHAYIARARDYIIYTSLYTLHYINWPNRQMLYLYKLNNYQQLKGVFKLRAQA
jgi:hypothetical protein